MGAIVNFSWRLSANRGQMSISQATSITFTATQPIRNRLNIEDVSATTVTTDIPDGSDVIEGLSKTPKSLPPKYFYDDRGSLLFEEICELPEYYPTRTEAAILKAYADEIVMITGASELVELGSGSSTKTRFILDAYRRAELPLRYLPIDVSAGILEDSAKTLLIDYPQLEIHGLVGTYEAALTHLPDRKLPRRTLIFLGSTLGNLNPEECDTFLSQVTSGMQQGDYFLLGVDLQKPKHILEAAYNDSQGVTAAFNLNMLDHLNWRFEGDFDIAHFSHTAIYNEAENQIEMYLQSLCEQTVYLEDFDLKVTFAKDEMMLTEISRKFDLETLKRQLQSHQLNHLKTHTDLEGKFGVVLCQLGDR